MVNLIVVLILSLIVVVMAIVASGIISLFASLIYIFLEAPDVAITEASIGSALTVIIFFYVLNKIRQNNVTK